MISKIDDFQAQTIWVGEKKKRIKYKPKDVGHQQSIVQPFHGKRREGEGVMLSTLLMLKIKEMALKHEKETVFHLKNNIIGD